MNNISGIKIESNTLTCQYCQDKYDLSNNDKNNNIWWCECKFCRVVRLKNYFEVFTGQNRWEYKRYEIIENNGNYKIKT